jgi:hypothetical protein
MSGYVRAMDSSPPPAPDSACATLSLCCAAVLWGTAAVDSASFNCAFSWVEDMFVGWRVGVYVCERCQEGKTRGRRRKECKCDGGEGEEVVKKEIEKRGDRVDAES